MGAVDELMPLLRWDPVRLSVSLDALERHLARVAARSERIRDLRLGGRGDVLELIGRVEVAGAPVRVRVGLCELRLKQGLVGGRIRRLEVLGGLRLPRRTLIAVLRRTLGDLATVFPDEGIVVVDLRRWLPPELRLKVIAVQVVGRTAELWLGPGALVRLPAERRRALPAGGDGTGAGPADARTADGPTRAVDTRDPLG